MADPLLPAETNDPRVDAALREYLERVDRGEAVNREEFISRHAEIAGELRSFFATEAPLRKMTATKISDPGVGVSTQSVAAHGQETVRPGSKPDRSSESPGSGFQGQFGRYQIIRALGKGAMGAVYLAQDTQLKRHVAIKVPHFEDDPTGELLKRFCREAEAAATLRNANICPVFDVGQVDGKHFISMAYIEGRPLADLVRSGKAQNERHVVIAVHKLARALQDAHDQGIVHRDLKPANIMVDKKGEPIIMDFGLARKAQNEGDASITHSGMLLGSPAYMSPEQVEGNPDSVGPASDQYSLGVVLYEMLTGQLPFRGSLVNVLAQIITKSPTPPSELRAGLDPRIEAVCLRMMAKGASDRFPSMKAVAEVLVTIIKNQAAAPAASEKSPTARRPPAALAPSHAEASPSQLRKSLEPRVLTESDLTSLDELARKCLRRHDYDQMIQIIERIPEARRNESLETLLQQARARADEIAFLVCEIDDAERLGDGKTALEKAAELLQLKPGHHRAKEIQEKYSGYGAGGAARIGPISRLTRHWSEGGWIPWSVLAFGFAVLATMCGVMFFYLRGTWIVVDVQDPEVRVSIQGSEVTVTGSHKEDVKVQPGDQELAITYGNLSFTTPTFTLKRGETKTVTISVVDKKVLARLEGGTLSLEPTDKARMAAGGPGQSMDLVRSSASSRIARLVAPFDAAAAKKGQEAWSSGLNLPVESTNSIGMKFRLIPSGDFTMGSTDAQIATILKWGSRWSKTQTPLERPPYRVKITHPFYLGALEVTRRDFATFAAATGYKTEGERDHRGSSQEFQNAKFNSIDWRNPGFPQVDTYPVVNVTGADAHAFCEWLSHQDGRAYRLPREAEWEYACRAGTTTLFYTGDDPQKAAKGSNMQGAVDGYEFFSPVGSFPPNPFGLYDMYGNACEMCEDAVTPNYAGHTAEGAPPATADRSQGVARGGGADCPPAYCRSAVRHFEPRSFRAPNTGFRVVCEIPGVSNAGQEKNQAAAAATPAAESKPMPFPRPFLIRGDWRIENDELVQPDLTAGYVWDLDNPAVYPLLCFGDESLSNYDLTVEVMKTGGSEQLGILFHWLRPGNFRRYVMVGNGALEFNSIYDGHARRDDGEWIGWKFSSNQWHTMKLEVRGEKLRGYFDDDQHFEKTDSRFTHGRIALCTWNVAARFRRIKLTDPQGRVLFEGLPQLPPGGKKATTKPDLGPGSRPLTQDEIAAKAAQQKCAERLKTAVVSANSLGMKLALIPAGEFQMGLPGQQGGSDPEHHVRITQPFYLGVDEVTQSEFERVLGRNTSWFHNGGGDSEKATGPDTSRFPVEGVTWYDAVEFCNKLSEKEKRRPYYGLAEVGREQTGQILKAKVSIEGGSGYCLPTEAQWEYACRAGTRTAFWFGTANNGAECNCNGTGPEGTEVKGPWLGMPTPVGSYRPNAWGLHDVAGNVFEWCWDYFDENYYKQSPQSDPPGPAQGKNRVQRGGCYAYVAGYCASSPRGNLPEDYRWPGTGFRVARDAARGEQSNPSSAVEGLPELAPGRGNAAPAANLANKSRPLTPGETAARKSQEKYAQRLKTPLIATNAIGMELALIPPGEFQMGSPPTEKDRHAIELQHRVRITTAFYLGVYEVTQGEFKGLMRRNPSVFPNRGSTRGIATGSDTSRLPVSSVTWYDAVEFCNKLSQKDGRRPYYRMADIARRDDGWIEDAKVSVGGGNGYRLPTEAQWEYACRAGTTTPFNFGTANNGTKCNCNGQSPFGTAETGPAGAGIVRVGSYRPNAFGLYDMHGNVWEWCWDALDLAYYKHSPTSDPTGPSTNGSLRVLRGGDNVSAASRCRSAVRFAREPDSRLGKGFRVACDATGGK